MKKTSSGFTIVELLIVIVVIGILAAITIVAYTGFQVRTKNTKTIVAASAWAKAINLYRLDTGKWPITDSCLGGANTYPDNGQCWSSATSWKVNTPFTSLIVPYMASPAEPDTTNADTVTSPKRGALYDYNSDTDVTLYIMLIDVSSCPAIGGGVTYYSTAALSPGRFCRYKFDTSTP